jgi:hypothetical protein
VWCVLKWHADVAVRVEVWVWGLVELVAHETRKLGTAPSSCEIGLGLVMLSDPLYYFQISVDNAYCYWVLNLERGGGLCPLFCFCLLAHSHDIK